MQIISALNPLNTREIKKKLLFEISFKNVLGSEKFFKKLREPFPSGTFSCSRYHSEQNQPFFSLSSVDILFTNFNFIQNQIHMVRITESYSLVYGQNEHNIIIFIDNLSFVLSRCILLRFDHKENIIIIVTKLSNYSSERVQLNSWIQDIQNP